MTHWERRVGDSGRSKSREMGKKIICIVVCEPEKCCVAIPNAFGCLL